MVWDREIILTTCAGLIVATKGRLHAGRTTCLFPELELSHQVGHGMVSGNCPVYLNLVNSVPVRLVMEWISSISHDQVSEPLSTYEHTHTNGSVNQIVSRRDSYVNAVLIASRAAPVNEICEDGRDRYFRGTPRVPGFFGGCCANCKWRDWGARCAVRNPNEVWLPYVQGYLGPSTRRCPPFLLALVRSNPVAPLPIVRLLLMMITLRRRSPDEHLDD